MDVSLAVVELAPVMSLPVCVEELLPVSVCVIVIDCGPLVSTSVDVEASLEISTRLNEPVMLLSVRVRRAGGAGRFPERRDGVRVHWLVSTLMVVVGPLLATSGGGAGLPRISLPTSWVVVPLVAVSWVLAQEERIHPSSSRFRRRWWRRNPVSRRLNEPVMTVIGASHGARRAPLPFPDDETVSP